MQRTVIFIDGSWLWHNIMPKNRQLGKIDFKKLVNRSIEFLNHTIEPGHVLSGVVFSASYPINVHPLDTEQVKKRIYFFETLEKKCGFSLDLHTIDFKGRRLFSNNRSPDDTWSPHEKCVDISIASNLIYLAALNKYDVSILMSGDRDFLPAIKKVQDLGKRVHITTMKGSCSQSISDTQSVMYIDDYIETCLLEA